MPALGPLYSVPVPHYRDPAGSIRRQCSPSAAHSPSSPTTRSAPPSRPTSPSPTPATQRTKLARPAKPQRRPACTTTSSAPGLSPRLALRPRSLNSSSPSPRSSPIPAPCSGTAALAPGPAVLASSSWRSSPHPPCLPPMGRIARPPFPAPALASSSLRGLCSQPLPRLGTLPRLFPAVPLYLSFPVPEPCCAGRLAQVSTPIFTCDGGKLQAFFYSFSGQYISRWRAMMPDPAAAI